MMRYYWLYAFSFVALPPIPESAPATWLDYRENVTRKEEVYGWEEASRPGSR